MIYVWWGGCRPVYPKLPEPRRRRPPFLALAPLDWSRLKETRELEDIVLTAYPTSTENRARWPTARASTWARSAGRAPTAGSHGSSSGLPRVVRAGFLDALIEAVLDDKSAVSVHDTPTIAGGRRLAPKHGALRAPRRIRGTRLSRSLPSSARCAVRDVADDRGELPRARPHRPVARRQVDVRHVAQFGEPGEEGIALHDGVLEQRCARHGRVHGFTSEQYDAVAIGRAPFAGPVSRPSPRSAPGCGRWPVAVGFGTAVHREHDGTPCRRHRVADRIDEVGPSARRAAATSSTPTPSQSPGTRTIGVVCCPGASHWRNLQPAPRQTPSRSGMPRDRCVGPHA